MKILYMKMMLATYIVFKCIYLFLCIVIHILTKFDRKSYVKVYIAFVMCVLNVNSLANVKDRSRYLIYHSIKFLVNITFMFRTIDFNKFCLIFTKTKCNYFNFIEKLSIIISYKPIQTHAAMCLAKHIVVIHTHPNVYLNLFQIGNEKSASAKNLYYTYL